ncbi:MAG: secretin and TonB N-terminal domain-containing protein [Candidatus Omnitrophica bacterium]|nr:secretin and TonB N-terminal domain-containing protein [Candidatus Omnitrophota bacterium]
MSYRRSLVAFIFIGLLTFITPLLSIAYDKTLNSVLDTRVSFNVSDAEIAGVLKVLAESFDLNIAVSEGITGKVSLTLKDVRLEDALDLILQDSGYFYRVKDNVILVQAAEKELVTEIVKLNYAKATEITASLGALKSENGSITAVEADNRLIIKEQPGRLKEILKEIEKLDKAPQQILIEARMIEVEDTDLSAFGVQWSGNLNLAGLTDGKGPLSSGRAIQIPGYTTSSGVITAATTAATPAQESGDFRLNLAETSADLTGGQFVYGLTQGRVQFSNIVDALIRTNKAQLLASPSIATLDGQEAKIIIGEKFPFRENTLTAVGTTETTKFVDIGVALRVTPNVLDNDQVQIKLHPEVSSLNQSLDAGPRIDTREATTTVIVKNGQTIVIAGLMRHDKTVIRQKVPILGNLPLLGLAFRNKSTDFVTKELAVFITPYIMRPSVGEEGEIVIDGLSPQIFYNRGVRLTQEFGIESLGKPEAQRYSEAIANFKNIARNYGESEVADDALYQLGYLYDEKMKKPALAAEAWNKLKVGYPDSPYLTHKLLSKLASAERKAEKEAAKQRKKFR